MTLDLKKLRLESGYFYCATPYSRFPGGIELAFAETCRIMAALIEAGVPVYSPIAHTHPIALHGGLDPIDHSIWLPADKPMMDAAHGLVVIMMATWEQSHGIAEEIKVFKRARKPVIYLHPEDIGC